MQSKKRTIALLTLLMTASLFLVYILRSGPYLYYDDTFYMKFAYDMVRGSYYPVLNVYSYSGAIQSVELFTIAITAFSFKLFGVSAYAAALPSIFEYTLLIMVVFFAGKELFGDYLGFLSGIFASTAPFVVSYATRTLPDIFAGLSVAVACYLFILTKRSKDDPELMFLSGLFAAITMSIKLEGALLVIVFTLAATFIQLFFQETKRVKGKSIYRGVLNRVNPMRPLLVGVALGVLLNLALFFIITGNPISHIIVYNDVYKLGIGNFYTLNQTIQSFGVMVNPFYCFLNSNSYTSCDPYIFPMGLFVLFGFVGSVLGIYKRNTEMMFLSIVAWIPLLYLFFGTRTFPAYTLIPVIDRFFAIIVMPISILAAYFIAGLYGSVARSSKISALLLVSLLLLSSFGLNIPTYLLLYQYNSGIRSLLGAYFFSANYITSKTQTPTIYFDDSLRNIGTVFSSFLTSYDKNLTVISTDYGPCNPTGSNAFLFESFFVGIGSSEKNSTNVWLDHNCSATLIRSFNSTFIVNASINITMETDLYKLGAVR